MRIRRFWPFLNLFWPFLNIFWLFFDIQTHFSCSNKLTPLSILFLFLRMIWTPLPPLLDPNQRHRLPLQNWRALSTSCPIRHIPKPLTTARHIQRVQQFVSDYLNLVIFGHFQNNFRPKNRNFQNCLAGSPFGLVLLGNFENFDFLAENYSENGQK